MQYARCIESGLSGLEIQAQGTPLSWVPEAVGALAARPRPPAFSGSGDAHTMPWHVSRALRSIGSLDGGSPGAIRSPVAKADSSHRITNRGGATGLGIGDAGFTLFELLVSIAIIGILVGMAVLAIGDNRTDRLRRSAVQLQTLVGLAQEEALFNGKELGVMFDEHGYTFYQLLDGKWRELEGDPQLRARTLPEDASLVLYIEGLEVDLEPHLLARAVEDDEEDAPATAAPHVLILSDGTVTPFELEIGDDFDTEVRLVSDPVGQAEIEVTAR